MAASGFRVQLSTTSQTSINTFEYSNSTAMSCRNLPQSCEQYLSYPLNLLAATTRSTRPALDAQKQALNNAITNLCVVNQRDAQVEVRDLAQDRNLGRHSIRPRCSQPQTDLTSN